MSEEQSTDSLNEGEHVQVTITGRVVAGSSESNLIVSYELVDRSNLIDEITISVNPSHSAVKVERLAPPEWPPRRGDLWADRLGYRYFALDEVLVGESGTPYFPETLRQKDGPMTLVNREAKS